ncbi:MAG: Transcriptional regulator, AcrR family [uncultured Nocardioidaceae bacterium]|uniref:Transcriptional regulator, AcrR family n=1 Tax=uncultured Nocardioidaceae bacterium TaxID=253824 RepID=A0A6J4MKP9_9ACTN|nr:MAG: Transcriptional regulator, AcrR family [uncultured Nocardioidaceae bacterium]
MIANLSRMSRRHEILGRAAELFAARGFHGVSMSDLGAACGVSGPALYRHFPAKDAMLAEMLVSISEELLDVGRSRAAAAASPEDALRALVTWHVDFALHNRALIVVQDRDWSSLPDDARERVRTLQREYVELWVEHILALHPQLDAPRGRAMAHASFGLINSTPHSTFLSEPEMAELLGAMAASALGVGGREA